MIRIFTILFITFAPLTGCMSVSTGNNFDSERISQIQKGSTTEAQLIALFGKPNLRTANLNTGISLCWSYSQGQSGFGSATSTNKTLVAWLDQSGIVTNFDYTTGSFNSK